LFVDEAQRLLAEFFRILRPDGVVRLVTPSFEHAMKIAAGHTAEDPQRSFDFPTGQAIDYLFCDGQHRYAYSHPLMEHFARAAGFTGVEHLDDLSAREYAGITLGPELAGSLLVELRR